uniref:Transmembrane protein n=1 Tax=Noccaea caerulescens TaxID=107243 RepID=A0A1J3K180_NOCCA
MKTISGLGIGLSLVFGFLLLALVAEVYYLLRWKKHKKRITSQESEEEKEEEQQIGYAKELIQLFCFKKPQSLQSNNGGGEGDISMNPDGTQDLELGLMKHLGGGDLGFEAELMKLHNQRFLFTIMEETKADLESEDGKSRLGSRSRTRSLSDLPIDCNTPGFTPLASPTTLKSSPLESYSHHGFNPLFESDGELEFNKFSRSSSSPPPKFKFLRDAEEKLRRRLIEEAKRRDLKPDLSVVSEGSFLKFMNPSVNRDKKQSIHKSDETVTFSHSSSSGTKS